MAAGNSNSLAAAWGFIALVTLSATKREASMADYASSVALATRVKADVLEAISFASKIVSILASKAQMLVIKKDILVWLAS